MLNLKEMFGDQNRTARQVSVRHIFDDYLDEVASLGDHVLKMIRLLNELEIFGFKINK